jgi:hypothetical protein
MGITLMKCLVSSSAPTIGSAREADQRGIRTTYCNRIIWSG